MRCLLRALFSALVATPLQAQIPTEDLVGGYLADRDINPPGAVADLNVEVENPDLEAEICDSAAIDCSGKNAYTINGSCNNLLEPYSAAAGQKYQRILYSPRYDLSLYEMNGYTTNSMPFNARGTMPNPRFLSQFLVDNVDPGNEAIGRSYMSSCFTQFVLNDISLAPKNEKVDCCGADYDESKDCSPFFAEKEDLNEDLCSTQEFYDELSATPGMTCYAARDGSYYNPNDQSFTSRCQNIAVVCMAEDLSFEDISHLVDGTPEPAVVEAAGAALTPVGELGFNMATLVNNELGDVSFQPLTDSDSVHLWRCTNRPESSQWSKPNFDDSRWLQAVNRGDGLLWTADTSVDGSDPAPKMAFCRYSIRPDLKYITVGGSGTVDMWLNGVKSDLPNGKNPGKSDKVYISGKKEVIGLRLDLKLQNPMEEYATSGLIFEISLKHSVTCVSSNNPDGQENWFSVGFNEDAKWQAPVPSMRTERIPGICHANWILSQTGFSPYLFCRIKLTNTDQCINYKRTLPFCDEPGTPRRAWREQVNYATGVLDLGNVYGNTLARSELLRTKENGLLKTSAASGTCSRGELPLRPVEEDQDVRFDDPRPTLVSGDDQHVVLPCVQALYTLFLRNHNTIATAIRSELASLNEEELDDEELYQRARKINIGTYQSIVVNEWLPFLLGTQTGAAATTMYDTTLIPGVLVSADLILKWTIPQGLPGRICSNDGTGPLSICDFQSSLETIADYHADILAGVGESPFFGADCATDNFLRYVVSNQELNDQVADCFRCNYLNNQDDLLARLIQTGRDHGVQGYERYSDFCGVDEASIEQSSPGQKKFLNQYQYRSDTDLLVGGTTEEGWDTFLCLIRAQFNRLRLGDRFFYSHSEQKNGDTANFTPAFNEEQRDYLNSRKLLHVICENTNVRSGYFTNSFRGDRGEAGSTVPTTMCSELQRFDVTAFNTVDTV